VLQNGVLWAMAVAAVVAISRFRSPFPYIVIGAGLIGYVGGRIAPRGGGHAVPRESYGRALIDDETPVLANARFFWLQTLVY